MLPCAPRYHFTRRLSFTQLDISFHELFNPLCIIADESMSITSWCRDQICGVCGVCLCAHSWGPQTEVKKKNLPRPCPIVMGHCMLYAVCACHSLSAYAVCACHCLCAYMRIDSTIYSVGADFKELLFGHKVTQNNFTTNFTTAISNLAIDTKCIKIQPFTPPIQGLQAWKRSSKSLTKFPISTFSLMALYYGEKVTYAAQSYN